MSDSSSATKPWNVVHPIRVKGALSRLPLFCILITVTIAQMGCQSDPFDPWLGPRNPRPAALRYLLERHDIREAEKTALLNYQPCSERTLTQLADAPAREVRFLVAVNSAANQAILEKLAADKDPAVRQGVAANRKTPRALLVTLARDPNKFVRFQATHNPSWSAVNHMVRAGFSFRRRRKPAQRDPARYWNHNVRESSGR